MDARLSGWFQSNVDQLFRQLIKDSWPRRARDLARWSEFVISKLCTTSNDRVFAEVEHQTTVEVGVLGLVSVGWTVPVVGEVHRATDTTNFAVIVKRDFDASATKHIQLYRLQGGQHHIDGR